ncbi:MAG: DUF3592 domain-containing protein [Verrucomicrobiota bacterium]
MRVLAVALRQRWWYRSGVEIVVGIVFTLGGLLFLFLAALISHQSLRRLRDWGSAPGRIVGYQESAQSGKCYYHPQVAFTARDGRTIVFAASTGSNRKGYRVGAEVKVLVDPANPDHVELRAFSTLWLPAAFLGFFGLVFAGVGISIILG